MMIPVRCFTCNKVIANMHHTYTIMQKEGISNEDIFKKIGFTRYCCKRMFLGHIEDDEIVNLSRLMENVSLHDKVENKVYLAR